MSPVVEFRGVITGRNDHLLTFTIDKKATIHYALKFDGRVPCLGCQVTIQLPHHHETVFQQWEHVVLCKECSISFQGKLLQSPPQQHQTYLNAIDRFNLGITDLLSIQFYYDYLKRNVKIDGIQADQLTFAFVRVLYSRRNTNLARHHTEDRCVRRVLPEIDLETVTCCPYLDQVCDLGAIPSSGWLYGVQHSTQFQYLLGHLTTTTRTGLVALKCRAKFVRCAITNRTATHTLSHFLHRIVIVTKFAIFTEFYGGVEKSVHEMIAFDLDDVKVLSTGNRYTAGQSCLIGSSAFSSGNRIVMNLQIIKMGSVCISNRRTFELWLEIIDDDNKIKKYLCLDESYSESFSLIELNRHYRVYLVKELVKRKSLYTELLYIDPTISQYSIPSNGATFVRSTEEDNERVPDGLISFRAKIVRKTFGKKNSSRTKQHSRHPEIGTACDATPKLVLHHEFMDVPKLLFLNNWENLMYPIGLIPNMIVIIRNVVHSQDKSYLKCSALTSFELVRYEPKVLFETTILNCVDWSPNIDLTIDGIPADVIVSSHLLRFNVSFLRLENKCSMCLKVHDNNECPTCDAVTKVSIFISLTIYGSGKPARVHAADQAGSKLFQVLYSQEHHFDDCVEYFRKFGQFIYRSDGKGLNRPRDHGHRQNRDRFINCFRQVIAVKCFKQANAHHDWNLYQLLDVH